MKAEKEYADNWKEHVDSVKNSSGEEIYGEEEGEASNDDGNLEKGMLI